ncbi:MAG: riboflavin synthase [Bacteroidetes bacterium]|jgi:riboflavin synthase|nr:riboflavin synthase [Bacteroidota bacterium]
MFTGIIESQAEILDILPQENNVTFRLRCPLQNEFNIDQSISHDGVCLTVDGLQDDSYTVTAIHETLIKTNLSSKKIGDTLNIERCMPAHGRFDGHIVQGHIDGTGRICSIENQAGSYLIRIEYTLPNHLTVSKGSIAINGISLTVVDSQPGAFSVAIIPYTWNHTNLQQLKIGNTINLEFDILGKYIQAWMKHQSIESNA